MIIVLAMSFLLKASEETSRDDMLKILTQFSAKSIFDAVLATIVSFVLMILLELLAFRSNGARLRPWRIAKVSFIAFSVSNTISLGGIASTSLRFRLYLKDKISSSNILRISAFSSAAVWLGFLSLFGFTALFHPFQLPAEFHVPDWGLPVSAGLSLLIAILYLSVSWAQKPKFKIRGETLSFPHLRFAFFQVLLSALDWMVASYALYVLIPGSEGLSYYFFLQVFLVAQIVGMVVTLPGGLGILEVLTIYMLAPNQQLSKEYAAALVLYRTIYYITPLVAALVLLAVEELVDSTHYLAVFARGLLNISARWVPFGVALAIAFMGFICFIEAGPLAMATPESMGKYLSASVLGVSIYGLILLILADGLRRRSFAAWAVALPFVILTAVTLILAHASWWAISAALFCATIMAFCRNEFFRHSRLFDEPLTTSWSILTGLIFLSFAGVIYGLWQDFSVVQYPWWETPSHPNYLWGLFLPSSVTLGGISLWRLIVPKGRIEKIPYIPLSLEQAAPLAMKSPVTQSQLVLLGDKNLFSTKDRNGFLMYALEGSTWVVLGDPIAPDAISSKQLVTEFLTFVDRQGGTSVHYQITPANLGIYIDLGYQFLKVGEEARVHLSDFSLEGRDRKSLRNSCKRVEAQAVLFEVIPRDQIADHWRKLEAISTTWLKNCGMKEKGFSLGYFCRQYLSNFDIAVLKKDGEIIAFANLWLSDTKEEMSIDLMRSGDELPSGGMDYMFVKMMEWGRDHGYKWFNLGMAPLSGLDRGHTLARTWNQFGSMLFDAGESLYNFKGVRNFKEKFSPVWEARYLAYPNGFSLPIALTDITKLISRGSKKGKSQ